MEPEEGAERVGAGVELGVAAVHAEEAGAVALRVEAVAERVEVAAPRAARAGIQSKLRRVRSILPQREDLNEGVKH